MKIAIIGGKLQGLEAVYLAKRAHFTTLLIDKHRDVPAKGLADQFLQFEFNCDSSYPEISGSLPDMILPACENHQTLLAVKQWAEENSIPFAADIDAYTLSSSKQNSNAVFAKLSIPAPLSWPECGFPAIIKPDNSSGSAGVRILHNESDLAGEATSQNTSQVLQEYLEGPSYSIEVVGAPGQYQTLQVTDLYMDEVYDCKRITAPSTLSDPLIKNFEEMARCIAEQIALRGIMDVEVILNRDQLKILEIDARLPSQTPITVFWSTGINMVAELVNIFTTAETPPVKLSPNRHVALEHIRVSANTVEVCGEHIIADCNSLQIHNDFFGADEAITNYQAENNEWVATLIFHGDSHETVSAKRYICYTRIKDRIL